MNNNTGSIFANKQPDGSFLAIHGGKDLRVTEISDTQLGITWGDHKDVLEARFSKFGKMFLVTLGEQRYIVGKRENQRGSYYLMKKGRDQGDGGNAAPAAANGQAPAQYGAR